MAKKKARKSAKRSYKAPVRKAKRRSSAAQKRHQARFGKAAKKCWKKAPGMTRAAMKKRGACIKAELKK